MTHHLHLLTGTMLAMLLLPSVAAAQEEQPNPSEQLSWISCGTSTTSASITGLGVFMVKQRENELREKIQIMKSIARLDRYLKDNGAGVRMALAIGAGPELREIALILGHSGPLSAAQRRALRRGRGAVLTALATPATQDRAERVFALLSTAIWRPMEVPA